jgi:hypothetical protein
MPNSARAQLRLVTTEPEVAPEVGEPPMSGQPRASGAPPGVWFDPWTPEGVVTLRAFDATGTFAGCFYCPADAYDPRIEEAMRAALTILNARQRERDVPRTG